MRTFNLPDLGEGLQEAEIVAWHVAVGDRVVADQPLVSDASHRERKSFTGTAESTRGAGFFPSFLPIIVV